MRAGPRASLMLTVLAVLVPIGIALQGFTLSTLLSIERRLTRLETLQGVTPGAERPRPELEQLTTWSTRA